MKTAGRETHNHWDRAHGVVGQEQTCSIKWAAKPRKIPAAGGLFFLTLPFIELTRHKLAPANLRPWYLIFPWTQFLIPTLWTRVSWGRIRPLLTSAEGSFGMMFWNIAFG